MTQDITRTSFTPGPKGLWAMRRILLVVGDPHLWDILHDSEECNTYLRVLFARPEHALEAIATYRQWLWGIASSCQPVAETLTAAAAETPALLFWLGSSPADASAYVRTSATWQDLRSDIIAASSRDIGGLRMRPELGLEETTSGRLIESRVLELLVSSHPVGLPLPASRCSTLTRSLRGATSTWAVRHAAGLARLVRDGANRKP